MQQGDCNAPAMFQHLMTVIFRLCPVVPYCILPNATLTWHQRCLLTQLTSARLPLCHTLPSSMPLSSSTNNSDGSHSSHRSLQSNKTSAPSNPKSGGKRARATTVKIIWTHDEIMVLLPFLQAHKASAGNNNFKEETFNMIAGEINTKFPSQKVLKTGCSCCSKLSNVCISLLWNNGGTHKVLQLKSEFNLVEDIRAASGFFYDDVKGATVNNTNWDAWASFCWVGPTHFDVCLCTDSLQVSPWCHEIWG